MGVTLALDTREKRTVRLALDHFIKQAVRILRIMLTPRTLS
jgi:hypothetical protein